MIFTNKHVVLALIIAPILSVIAWFAVDAFIGEQPHAAKTGQSYPLVAQSNCRYESGACDLENEDFTVTIQLIDGSYLLSSEYRIESALMAAGSSAEVPAPNPMQPIGATGKSWRIDGLGVPEAEDRIFVVIQSNGVTFFGDAATVFTRADNAGIPLGN